MDVQEIVNQIIPQNEFKVCVLCREKKELNFINFRIIRSWFSTQCRECLKKKSLKDYYEKREGINEKRRSLKQRIKEKKINQNRTITLFKGEIKYFENEYDILEQIEELEEIKKMTIHDISQEELNLIYAL